jgi:hypothetical protein
MATNAFIEFRLNEAQALADYTSIAYDLRTARDFARAILEESQKPQPNFSLSDPFMVATIIRYARAFLGGVRLKLYDDAVGVLTEQQRARHIEFMHIRDKYIAHSVNAFEESEHIARYWVAKVQEEGISAIECNHRRVAGLSEHDLKSIIDLASTWLQHVQKNYGKKKIVFFRLYRKSLWRNCFETLLRSLPRRTHLNHRSHEGDYEALAS